VTQQRKTMDGREADPETNLAARGSSRGLAGILGAFTTPRKRSSVGWQAHNSVMADQLELRFGGAFSGMLGISPSPGAHFSQPG